MLQKDRSLHALAFTDDIHTIYAVCGRSKLPGRRVYILSRSRKVADEALRPQKP